MASKKERKSLVCRGCLKAKKKIEILLSSSTNRHASQREMCGDARSVDREEKNCEKGY
jgi:hypothetical protein